MISLDVSRAHGYVYVQPRRTKELEVDSLWTEDRGGSEMRGRAHDAVRVHACTGGLVPYRSTTEPEYSPSMLVRKSKVGQGKIKLLSEADRELAIIIKKGLNPV